MVIGNSLPPGLTLTSGGVLSGTPTLFGSFTFAIQANDSHRCTGKRQYLRHCPLSPATLPNGTVGNVVHIEHAMGEARLAIFLTVSGRYTAPIATGSKSTSLRRLRSSYMLKGSSIFGDLVEPFILPFALDNS